jgi:hypothetical protein
MANEKPRTYEDDEREAKSIINVTLDKESKKGNHNPKVIESAIRERARFSSNQVRNLVNQYNAGVFREVEGTEIEELEKGVGGLYNGSKEKIALETLKVHDDIKKTIENSKEVAAHEAYHADNKHLEAMKTVDENAIQKEPGKEGGWKNAKKDAALVMGKKEFTEEQLIEGLTVKETGDKFVSKEYQNHKAELEAGMSAAGLDINQVREAVNEKKDLTLIDDRTQEKEDAAETPYAMAA